MKYPLSKQLKTDIQQLKNKLHDFDHFVDLSLMLKLDDQIDGELKNHLIEIVGCFLFVLHNEQT
jgi:hypothetical protein